ncbi:unnamed protein product [Owenia fusiformis]|uniref:Uncharacterized protein n=1 Tax=Owenia fusiformis TaxID=6347 RepID=A0A8J1XM18_OWEFU|nr:unnamed protein product [Owenia fusiformis]
MEANKSKSLRITPNFKRYFNEQRNVMKSKFPFLTDSQRKKRISEQWNSMSMEMKLNYSDRPVCRTPARRALTEKFSSKFSHDSKFFNKQSKTDIGLPCSTKIAGSPCTKMGSPCTFSISKNQKVKASEPIIVSRGLFVEPYFKSKKETSVNKSNYTVFSQKKQNTSQNNKDNLGTDVKLPKTIIKENSSKDNASSEPNIILPLKQHSRYDENGNMIDGEFGFDTAGIETFENRIKDVNNNMKDVKEQSELNMSVVPSNESEMATQKQKMENHDTSQNGNMVSETASPIKTNDVNNNTSDSNIKTKCDVLDGSNSTDYPNCVTHKMNGNMNSRSESTNDTVDNIKGADKAKLASNTETVDNIDDDFETTPSVKLTKSQGADIVKLSSDGPNTKGAVDKAKLMNNTTNNTKDAKNSATDNAQGGDKTKQTNNTSEEDSESSSSSQEISFKTDQNSKTYNDGGSQHRHIQDYTAPEVLHTEYQSHASLVSILKRSVNTSKTRKSKPMKKKVTFPDLPILSPSRDITTRSPPLTEPCRRKVPVTPILGILNTASLNSPMYRSPMCKTRAKTKALAGFNGTWGRASTPMIIDTLDLEKVKLLRKSPKRKVIETIPEEYEEDPIPSKSTKLEAGNTKEPTIAKIKKPAIVNINNTSHGITRITRSKRQAMTENPYPSKKNHTRENKSISSTNNHEGISINKSNAPSPEKENLNITPIDIKEVTTSTKQFLDTSGNISSETESARKIKGIENDEVNAAKEINIIDIGTPTRGIRRNVRKSPHIKYVEPEYDSEELEDIETAGTRLILSDDFTGASKNGNMRRNSKIYHGKEEEYIENKGDDEKEEIEKEDTENQQEDHSQVHDIDNNDGNEQIEHKLNKQPQKTLVDQAANHSTTSTCGNQAVQNNELSSPKESEIDDVDTHGKKLGVYALSSLLCDESIVTDEIKAVVNDAPTNEKEKSENDLLYKDIYTESHSEDNTTSPCNNHTIHNHKANVHNIEENVELDDDKLVESQTTSANHNAQPEEATKLHEIEVPYSPNDGDDDNDDAVNHDTYHNEHSKKDATFDLSIFDFVEETSQERDIPEQNTLQKRLQYDNAIKKSKHNSAIQSPKSQINTEEYSNYTIDNCAETEKEKQVQNIKGNIVHEGSNNDDDFSQDSDEDDVLIIHRDDAEQSCSTDDAKAESVKKVENNMESPNITNEMEMGEDSSFTVDEVKPIKVDEMKNDTLKNESSKASEGFNMGADSQPDGAVCDSSQDSDDCGFIYRNDPLSQSSSQSEYSQAEHIMMSHPQGDASCGGDNVKVVDEGLDEEDDVQDHCPALYSPDSMSQDCELLYHPDTAEPDSQISKESENILNDDASREHAQVGDQETARGTPMGHHNHINGNIETPQLLPGNLAGGQEEQPIETPVMSSIHPDLITPQMLEGLVEANLKKVNKTPKKRKAKRAPAKKRTKIDVENIGKKENDAEAGENKTTDNEQMKSDSNPVVEKKPPTGKKRTRNNSECSISTPGHFKVKLTPNKGRNLAPSRYTLTPNSRSPKPQSSLIQRDSGKTPQSDSKQPKVVNTNPISRSRLSYETITSTPSTRSLEIPTPESQLSQQISGQSLMSDTEHDHISHEPNRELRRTASQRSEFSDESQLVTNTAPYKDMLDIFDDSQSEEDFVMSQKVVSHRALEKALKGMQRIMNTSQSPLDTDIEERCEDSPDLSGVSQLSDSSSGFGSTSQQHYTTGPHLHNPTGSQQHYTTGTPLHNITGPPQPSENRKTWQHNRRGNHRGTQYQDQLGYGDNHCRMDHQRVDPQMKTQYIDSKAQNRRTVTTQRKMGDGNKKYITSNLNNSKHSTGQTKHIAGPDKHATSSAYCSSAPKITRSAPGSHRNKICRSSLKCDSTLPSPVYPDLIIQVSKETKQPAYSDKDDLPHSEEYSFPDNESDDANNAETAQIDCSLNTQNGHSLDTQHSPSSQNDHSLSTQYDSFFSTQNGQHLNTVEQRLKRSPVVGRRQSSMGDLCDLFGDISPPESQQRKPTPRRVTTSMPIATTSNFEEMFEQNDIFM